MRYNILAGFAAFLMVVVSTISCSPETELNVSGSTSVSASSEGGNFGGISVKANYPWSASSSASWIVINEQGGETLRFTVSPNTSYETREGSVNIVCNELSSTIKVTQSQNDGMLLAQKEFTVGKDGDQVIIEVKYNVNYKVSIESDGDWISEVTTKGLESRNHIFEAKANRSKLQRRATITFEGSGMKEEAKIVQDGDRTLFSITHDALTFTVPSFPSRKTAGSVIWGDGTTSDYAEGLSHQYSSAGEYTVTFNLTYADSFKTPDLKGVTFIDLREF